MVAMRSTTGRVTWWCTAALAGIMLTLGCSDSTSAAEDGQVEAGLDGGADALADAADDLPAPDTSVPACANVPVTTTDTDGDGLTDDVELNCWELSIDTQGLGEYTKVLVGSDPTKADTDGDGLSDAEEKAGSSDPRRADTDGDGLTDIDELRRYGSEPNSVDSDGDCLSEDKTSCATKLKDGSEVNTYHTSPRLKDTDGDALSDYDEITQAGGNNPRVADLPDLQIAVDSQGATITLNAKTTSSEENVTSNLTSSESSWSTSDSKSNQTTVESSKTISSKASVSYPWAASLEVTGEYSESESYVSSETFSSSKASSKSAQDEYQKAQSKASEYADGSIQVPTTIENRSNRNAVVKNIELSAYRLEKLPGGPVFKSVASLGPANIPGEGYEVAKGISKPKVIFENTSVSVPAILDLLRNPQALVFQVGNYSLYTADSSGAADKSFTQIFSEVKNLTGLLVIDYGLVQGKAKVERYNVATNVELDANGKAKGVSLKQVFNTSLSPALPYKVATDASGRSVLTSLDGVSALDQPPKKALWVVVGQGPDFAPNSTVGFEDLMLKPGKRISLIYLTDSDGDGLFDREENIYLTDSTKTDSDGDGRDDYAETKTSWTVSVTGSTAYDVFSDPNDTDFDGDGLNDFVEAQLKTDPYKADTDGDGSDDQAEYSVGTNPLNPDSDGDGVPDGYDPLPKTPLAAPSNTLPFSACASSVSLATSNVKVGGKALSAAGLASVTLGSSSTSAAFSFDYYVGGSCAGLKLRLLLKQVKTATVMPTETLLEQDLVFGSANSFDQTVNLSSTTHARGFYHLVASVWDPASSSQLGAATIGYLTLL